MTASKKEKSGCLSIFLPFFKKEPIARVLPYRLRDDFLSPAEFSFYKILSSLVGEGYTIQSKVRLADIFFVSRPNENVSFFSRISQKHLDFLVCDSKVMKPMFGIELDDSSHERKDRHERDEFIDQVCQTAGLPLLRVPAQREYNSREIASQIAPFLKDKVGISAVPQLEMNKSTDPAPLCPKCGIPMVLRTVVQGEHKGKQFYGCSNYPRCREMKPFSI
jgi:hypothetical protein